MVAVGLAGVVLAGVAAASVFAAQTPVRIAELAVDPAGDDLVVDAAAGEPPAFPIGEEMLWTAPLGKVLGWEVWAGRSRSNFACLVIERSGTERADCVAPGDFTRQGVTLYLPPSDVAIDLRPTELVGDHAVAYRWTGDEVDVEVRR